MMNTSAVSPPTTNAAGDTPPVSRDAGRQDGAAGGEQGGFRGLLSKLAGNEEQGDRPAELAKDPRGRSRDASATQNWWRSAKGMPGDVDRVAELEQALAQQSGTAAGSGDIDLEALLRALSASGDMTGATDGIAGIVGRVANGTQTPADSALMRAALAANDGEPLSPQQLILATLAKASADRTAAPSSGDMKTATAALTVLRRETHLGPTQVSAATNRANPWAGVAEVPGNRDAIASALTDNLTTPNGKSRVPGGAIVERLAQAHLAAAQSSGVAASAAEAGGEGLQSELSSAVADADPDAVSAIGREQTFAPTRSDALSNTGLATGVTQQIADRVAGEIGTFAREIARPDAAAFTVKHESAVKVLHIQLQPADLGVVTIRMSVKESALRLELEVGRGETANLIQRDREALSALLRSAGYLIDGVDVRVADQAGAGANPGSSQTQMQMHMQGGQSGSSHAEARLPGERSHDESRNTPFGNGSNGEDQEAGQAAGRRGIYL